MKIKNFRYNGMIARSFRTVFMGVALPLMAVIVSIYLFSQDILSREIEVANLRALDTVENIANTVFEGALTASLRISLDEDVRLVLKLNAPEKYSDFERARSVINLLEACRVDSFIDSIYLYDCQSDYLITDNAYASRMKFTADKGILDYLDRLPQMGVYWTIRDMQPQLTEGKIPVLSMFREVSGSGIRGVVVINIHLSSLSSLLSGARGGGAEGSVVLVREDGTILFDDKGDYAGQSVMEALGEDAEMQIRKETRGALPVEYRQTSAMAAFTRLSGTGWTLIKLVPYHTYAGSLIALRAFVLGSMGLGMLVSLIVAAILAERLHRPIEQIVRFIDRSAQDGALAADDELNYILLHLVSLYDENKLLEQERLTRYAALRNAQAHALHAQITPHFLHNTLQAVSWQVLKSTRNERDPALQALMMLSDMARELMEDTGNLTTLKAELDYVTNYVALQKLRYLDALQCEWSAPAELYSIQAPRMCLQPLVENAIEHALLGREGKGRIEIVVIRDGDDAVIEVSDDGAGMPPEQMDELNRAFIAGGENFVRHIGLRNVNLRIQLLFGEAYHLHITSSRLGGITVSFRLPI